MKFILTFIFCSGMAGTCLPPVQFEGSYKDLYTCLDAGYKESIVQLKSIGPADVNQKRIFIKFYCSPMQET
jgi:hypothetical protein